MKTRLPYTTLAPEPYQAMLRLESAITRSGLERALIHLVKLRASQINGCLFCIETHVKEAHADGDTDERLHALDAWQEAPYFTDRERAALAWTEAVTHIAETHAPDAAYEEARRAFSEKELVDLTWVIAAINAWNRMAISMRALPP
jgi:AhpD family alkylhydroperoxidase